MWRINLWLVVLLCAFYPLFTAQAEPPSSFESWLPQFKQQAEAAGIGRATIESGLSEVRFLPWVIRADRRQPEFNKSLSAYLADAVTAQRVAQGRRLLRENRSLLQGIAQKYRVQAHYLVALWGIESNYGRTTGKVPILSALATLAYDARRSDYFRAELITLLRLLDSGKLEKAQLLGSWAGAMGQLQFMPSTFDSFAVDGNADGRIDLWNSREDYLSSAANYLHKSGWQWRYRWGRKVKIPSSFDSTQVGLDFRAPLRVWQGRGVRLPGGEALPQDDLAASLVLPAGQGGPAFLIYENYRVLLRWNRAHSFALAVGLLAERIAGN